MHDDEDFKDKLLEEQLVVVLGWASVDIEDQARRLLESASRFGWNVSRRAAAERLLLKSATSDRRAAPRKLPTQPVSTPRDMAFEVRLTALLQEHQLALIDNRMKGGALWVRGHGVHSLSDVRSKLEGMGFSEVPGKGWWKS